MIWRKHLDRVLNDLISNLNILSDKARNDLLSFPNVASQAFFDSILASRIRTLGTSFECFFQTIITYFLMQLLGDFKKNVLNK